MLGQLIKSSDAEQIGVYDRILAEQPEFSFVSGQLLSALNSNALVESEDSLAGADPKRRFRRHNLAWLVALARIELAATVAMYGDTPNAFEFLAPQGFGSSEYFALLLEDMAVHLRALEQDPLFKRVRRRSDRADSDTLAYMRRLKIVEQMLRVVRNSEDQELAAGAENYLRQVEKSSRTLAAKAEWAAADYASSNVRESTESSEFRDLQAGTVRSVSPITLACQRRFLRIANHPGR